MDFMIFSCLVGGIRGWNGSGAGIQIRRKTINVDPSNVRKIGRQNPYHTQYEKWFSFPSSIFLAQTTYLSLLLYFPLTKHCLNTHFYIKM